MNDRTITSIVSILLAVIGVAVLAVLVSKQAKTGDVIQSLSSGFARLLCAAFGPITGQSCGGNESVSSTVTFGDIIR